MVHVALEWGPVGARTLAERSDVLVLVDVLSFYDLGHGRRERGVTVWPHAGGETAPSCSPATSARCSPAPAPPARGPRCRRSSLLELAPGTRLILPSPNGSGIAHAVSAAGIPVFAGCLRNAAAVVSALDGAERVGLVPAGERWPDGSLRPAYEDLVGAGAIAAGARRARGRVQPRRAGGGARVPCSDGRWRSARAAPSSSSAASSATSSWPRRSTSTTWSRCCVDGRFVPA